MREVYPGVPFDGISGAVDDIGVGDCIGVAVDVDEARERVRFGEGLARLRVCVLDPLCECESGPLPKPLGTPSSDPDSERSSGSSATALIAERGASLVRGCGVWICSGALDDKVSLEGAVIVSIEEDVGGGTWRDEYACLLLPTGVPLDGDAEGGTSHLTSFAQS